MLSDACLQNGGIVINFYTPYCLRKNNFALYCEKKEQREMNGPSNSLSYSLMFLGNKHQQRQGV